MGRQTSEIALAEAPPPSVGETPHGLRLDVARIRDESELRRLLRENPMQGDISLSLEREPDYFAAAALEGPRHRTIVVRDGTTGGLAGLGSRSARRCFVNGKRVWLPYLAALRFDRRRRAGLRLLRAGYDLCGTLRRADELPYCLTSIAADNVRARRLLGTGLPGLPVYRELEPVATLVIPSGPRTFRERFRALHTAPPRVHRGSPRHMNRIAAFLQRSGRRYQFHPLWTTEDLASLETTRGLDPRDFFLAVRDGEIVGCLALWDQRAFKQAVVRGYSRRMARLRPFVNLIAPCMAAPRLPATGDRIEAAYLSHAATRDDDADVMTALIGAARTEARARGIECLLFGMARRNPMLPRIRRAFRHRAYRSMLYLVHWSDGAGAAGALDGRVPHVEIATL